MLSWSLASVTMPMSNGMRLPSSVSRGEDDGFALHDKGIVPYPVVFHFFWLVSDGFAAPYSCIRHCFRPVVFAGESVDVDACVLAFSLDDTVHVAFPSDDSAWVVPFILELGWYAPPPGCVVFLPVLQLVV